MRKSGRRTTDSSKRFFFLKFIKIADFQKKGRSNTNLQIARLRESLSGRDADENSRVEAERQREAENAQIRAEFEAQQQRLKEELDVVRQQRLLLEKQIDEVGFLKMFFCL